MANRPAAGSLTDDLIVEILSRLPVKSLCRCKCASRRWRSLISHPDHRRRLPQTLAGFFLDASNRGRQGRRFTNLGEASRPPLICYPFTFMPGYEDVTVVDSCNGLLLCRASRTESSSPDAVFCHVVCNPATRSWHVSCATQLLGAGMSCQTPALVVWTITRSCGLLVWVLILQFPWTFMCLNLSTTSRGMGAWQGWRSILQKLEHGGHAWFRAKIWPCQNFSQPT